MSEELDGDGPEFREMVRELQPQYPDMVDGMPVGEYAVKAIAEIARLKAELAGSQNEAKALSESLDGMEKQLTETQKALDEAKDGWRLMEANFMAAAPALRNAACLRDTANELLRRVLTRLQENHSGDFAGCKDCALMVEITAHLKMKEDHL